MRMEIGTKSRPRHMSVNRVGIQLASARQKQEPLAPRWLTVDATAEYIGLSPATIYTYVSERRIPHVKIPKSNQVRFDRQKIDA